jgi:hypothetical protein
MRTSGMCDSLHAFLIIRVYQGVASAMPSGTEENKWQFGTIEIVP